MNKVVFITDNWFGDFGGRKRITQLLVNNLNNLEITLLTLDTKISLDRVKNFTEGLKKEVKIYPYFIPSNVFLLPRVFFRFGYFLKKHKPSLVVLAGGGTHSNAFFVLITKFFLPDKRLVIINHGNPDQFLKKQNFILKYLTKILYRKADKIVSVSKQIMESLKERFGLTEKQCLFIYNGLNLEDIAKKTQEKIEYSWLKEDVPKILSVGRLDAASKDFATLLRALALVLEEMSVKLIIIGEGPQKNDLEILAKELKIYKNVWFAGYQENPYKFMDKSDLFILSSCFESFGIVLVEAMACGLPVISSDCDFGPREILENGEYGILIPVGNHEVMAKSIIKILKNERETQELIIKGKKRAQQFNMRKFLTEYESLFNLIVS